MTYDGRRTKAVKYVRSAPSRCAYYNTLIVLSHRVRVRFPGVCVGRRGEVTGLGTRPRWQLVRDYIKGRATCRLTQIAGSATGRGRKGYKRGRPTPSPHPETKLRARNSGAVRRVSAATVRQAGQRCVRFLISGTNA